ncbi:MAG: DNA polymerase III subunit epsilon [Gammaproteobacteria bacterium]|nr:DNA polymerase III subunit epsilon [Gammaproteobacteria bacterium]
MERLIALDTETTGFETSEGHRIIEVGAVEIIDREIKDKEFQKYVQPNRNVGESVKVHGITDRFLINKPQFKEIAEDLLEFIKGSTLLIHNAPFDLGFLNHELKLAGIKKTIESICPIIDTLELSKQQRPGTMHSLDALCRRFEIDASSRTIHGALLDAKILAQVYLAMTGGQSNLFQETDSNKIQKVDQSLVKRTNKKGEKLTIIYANKDEIEEHNNYF